MVQRLSAQLYLPRESRYPVPSNHTDLVKFDSSRNKSFQTVVTSMEGIGECFISQGAGESVARTMVQLVPIGSEYIYSTRPPLFSAVLSEASCPLQHFAGFCTSSLRLQG